MNEEGATMTKRQITWTTIGLLFANIMAGFEGTIISTAMPTIIADLNGIEMMNWLFTIYFLLNAIFTPIWGKISDRIGRKKGFMLAISIFMLGSFLEGLSPTMLFMIFARGIMGIGAGGMTAIPFIIFARIYPAEKRGGIFGLTAAFGGAASVIGPLLGGWIVSHLSWHWVFFINIPIGLISLAIVQIAFQEQVEKVKKPVDLKGSAFFSFGLLFSLFGIQQLGNSDNSVGLILSCFIGAIVFFYLFIRAERVAIDPMIPLHLFKNYEMLTKDFMAFTALGFFIAFSIYIPMWGQGVLGLSALIAGLTQVPTAGLWYGGSRIATANLRKIPSSKIINRALLTISIGALVLVFSPEQVAYPVFIVAGLIFGLGLGALLSTAQVAATEVVAPEDLAVSTTLNRLSSSLGQTMMASIYGLVFNRSLTTALAGTRYTIDQINQLSNPETAKKLAPGLIPDLRQILYSGIHHVMITALGLILLALLINQLSHRFQKVRPL